MAEQLTCENSIYSKQQRYTKEDKKKDVIIRPYNYDCQQDQYNVKLCGLVFDAIGVPDFFVQNQDDQNTQTDVFQ
ncbi:unnamed protein product [Paramecium pentaurelia]|uniref:Uncharacterized protein n=1 Tax=Paramecium pentaurelia TaxID=43138 RepID=A0A8S1Y564_9CILI|nr:unnamed protein product [Paramecium pentaurelia]